MNLQERLMDDLKNAMRSGNTIEKNSIRMIRAAVKNAEIDMKRTATDAEVENIISKEIKRRLEAVEMFTKGGREDLVQEEKAGIAFLEQYLPKQLTEQELDETIEQILTELGATSMKDMGPAMKAIMAKVGNRADGRIVSDKVRAKLA